LPLFAEVPSTTSLTTGDLAEKSYISGSWKAKAGLWVRFGGFSIRTVVISSLISY
jgi:hypothetical protein